jgi:hypothetical protein
MALSDIEYDPVFDMPGDIDPYLVYSRAGAKRTRELRAHLRMMRDKKRAYQGLPPIVDPRDPEPEPEPGWRFWRRWRR